MLKSGLVQGLLFKGNWLKAGTKSSFLPYKLISEINKKSYNVNTLTGFQMAWSSKNSELTQGTLSESVNRGLEAGAKYFELYEIDILDKNNKEYLTKLNKALLYSNN